MANPFFRFKQFTVYHDKCAMKIGTDGVLLGAWANVDAKQTILDIGCGSGLISLMLAQRNAIARIDAIDIEQDAIIQTKENIARSPFHQRIECKQISLQEIEGNPAKIYDSIVSNPPFFNNSLKSPDKLRSLARHTDSLYIDELIAISTKHLTPNGCLSIIFPFAEKDNLKEIALSCGLYATRITNVFPTPSSNAKRILLEFSKLEPLCVIENDLIIEISRHIYSDDFKVLLKNFYLKM